MQVFNLIDAIHEDSGAFATYYRVSKDKGLKVLRRTYTTNKEEAIRQLELEDCSFGDWAEAYKEAKLMQRAQHLGLSPKCYGVAVASNGYGTYNPAIYMEHIEGITISDLETLEYNDDKSYDLSCEAEAIYMEYIAEIYEETGISLTDDHNGNGMVVIVDDKIENVYVIDFTPSWLEDYGEPE